MVEPNVAPVLGKDNVPMDEDTSLVIDVLSNDSDANGDTLTVTSVAAALHGQVTVNPDNTLTYIPDANFNGTDSFFYTVNDGNGGISSQRVNVTVNPVDEAPNDLPSLGKDSAIVDEDSSVVIHVLANDSDADGGTLTVVSVDGLKHGRAIINPDNTITYTPNPDYNGTESFLYTVADGQGGSSTQRVNVVINPVADEVEPNAAPVLGKDNVTGNEDTVITINVLANDSDANGDTLTVTGVSGLHHGTAVINPDNTISYTPGQDYNGSESFLYTVSDGNGGVATQRVNVTVASVPDADIEGTLGDDTPLNGTDNSESIAGLAGNDHICAGMGDDTIIGGYGNDYLYGQGGMDTFVFTVNGGLDTVEDFSISEGDKLNFDALITGFDPLTESIHDFLSATTNGADTIVSVDRDGTGTDYTWQQVVVVENVILPPIEPPTV